MTYDSSLSSQLDGLALHARTNSERWFPQLHDGSMDLPVFYGLGLAGEVGEVCNIVKKLARNQPGLNKIDLYAGLAEELADVFTYLMLLAHELDVDLISEYEHKVDSNERRWGS